MELALCVVCMLLAYPVSKSIAAHYAVFAWINLMFLGVEYADSSLLAMVFATLVVADVILWCLSRRLPLLISASASVALSLESVGNGDWLLSHVVWLSIATNAVIFASVGKEYFAWMHGKYSR